MLTRSEEADLNLKAAAIVFAQARADLHAAGDRWRVQDHAAFTSYLLGTYTSERPADYVAAQTSFLSAQHDLEVAAVAVHALTPVAVNVIPQEPAHAE